MGGQYNELSTYILIRRYQALNDKTSPQAIELAELIRGDLNLAAEADLSSGEIQDELNRIVQKGKRKSEKFINVVAWIFIVITGFSLLGSGCGLMSLSTISRYMAQMNSFITENANPVFKFIVENRLLLIFLSFALSLAMFVSAIGVLYRSDLARKFGIAFFIYGIARSFISPLMVIYVYPSVHSLSPEIPQSMIDNMYNASMAMSIFFSVIFIAVYGWLIYKFTSPEIKEEFR